MSFLEPQRPPYDALAWRQLPFAERARLACQAWALQGYGTPIAVYLVYVLKVGLYIAGWWLCCRFSPGLGDLGSIGSWWLEPVAFQKAILWSMLFEALGLGCGSGPLTARYMPPIGGFLYFLRPRTTKLPFRWRDLRSPRRAEPVEPPPAWRALGTRRTWLDVLLYAAFVVLVVRALVSPAIDAAMLAPICALVVLLGLLDKSFFLAARSEHYWTTIMVMAMTTHWIPGAKAIELALWFWAGVSKLNHHFPAVVCVMTSNSPFTRFEWLRKLMYRKYPDDLTPSKMAVIAHGGIVLELGVPVLLFLGDGGPLTIVGLVAMVFLHAFITSNVPMGVPIEWNVMMVYGGFFLFWKNADVSVLAMQPHVAIFLLVMLIAVPLAGNLWPSRVSFLPAMRYYAGNWAFSVWLFAKQGQSWRKLDKLVKSSDWIEDQLRRLYDPSLTAALLSKVMAFRLMHLHGRALPVLLPKAIERLEDYEWVEGEVVAGMVLGWNFGDGHLHQEELLAAVQEQCGFEDGELRCIFVEGQPLGKKTLSWRVADASRGVIESGEIAASELLRRQPWEA